MLDTLTAMRFYELPEEGPAAHAYLVTLMDGAKHSLYLRMFGFTDRVLAQALLDAHARGVDCWLLLDHLQDLGHVEAQLVHWLVLRGFPADHLCIATSPQHQFMHEKELVVDGEADLPDVQFDTVEEARLAGYPLVVTGSTNWSPTAFKQSNHLLILPGKAFAALCLTQFHALWNWAMAHEAAYQDPPQAANQAA